ncbi:unnamed protein product [Musa textilis]
MASTTMTPVPDYRGQALAPSGHRSGSLGPFFAVISAIVILTVFSCVFGRVCASRVVGPDASYDCVGWTRRRWSWCTWRRSIVSEAKAAVAAESEPSLAMPQP